MANPHEQQDEAYNSASDEDFNPDEPVPNVDEAASSSDEDEAGSGGTKRRRAADVEETGDFDNSGDEATIRSGLKKRRKTKPKDGAHHEEDDEGGEGGLVKTRAQRRAEVQEKRPVVNAAASTVDVNALFAQMSGAAAAHSSAQTNNHIPAKFDLKPPEPSKDTFDMTHLSNTNGNFTNKSLSSAEPPGIAREADDMMTIKRKYDFAGQTVEEEHVVHKDSEQARRYLEEQVGQNNVLTSTTTTKKPPPRRPIKKSSIFDSDPGTNGQTETNNVGKGKKLNTLEKSKLDWAAHVDQEGMGDELIEHRKAKDTYLGRKDFLDRMSAQRDDDLLSHKR